VAVGKMLSCLLAVVLIGAAVPAFSATTEDVHCAGVKPGERFQFQGHTLLETPDIQEPELRLINALITEQCFDQAAELMDRFVTAHPDNYHVFFVKARFHWITMGQANAHVIVENALRLRPDFSSMKILLASMDIDDKNFPDAEKLLNEVEAIHPEDLWLFMDRLRIESEVTPTPDITKTLAAIVADMHFPVSARRQAMNTAKYQRGLSVEQRDQVFTAGMDSGAGKDCELSEQAVDLIEFRGDPADGARLIEKYFRKNGECVATPEVRTLLAEAYLLEATKIAPQPTRKTEALVNKAEEALGGDFMPLGQRVAIRPQLSALLPYLKGTVDVRETDDNGHTLICSAIIGANPAMVNAQLSEGADPNGRCEHESLVGRILLTAASSQIEERQTILRSLLERGGRVELLKSCGDPKLGTCYTNFYPILKEFEDRRAQTRESL